MTDKEKQLAEKCLKASLIAEMAKNAWSGNLKAARIDCSLSDRLKPELKNLLGKGIWSNICSASTTLCKASFRRLEQLLPEPRPLIF
jgi:hypothetical protein